MRRELDHEIQLAKDQILILGSMVEQAIYQSVKALKDNDTEASQAILEGDRLINYRRYEIETSIIVAIATQQPIAHDLRLLTALLSLCTELERMGDYAKGIAVINLRSGSLGLPKLLNDLFHMQEKAVDMLHRAMTACIHEDKEAAYCIAREDELIDALYEQVYYEAIDLTLEDARNIERVNYVLWAAHNLERFADRVTNVCERTVFIATGELVELPLREFDYPPPAH